MALILASSSETRKNMLINAGLVVESVSPRIDEESIGLSMVAEGASPRDVADKLAEVKSAKVSNKRPGSLVLGCDQILALDSEILSKSQTKDDAERVLIKLRGKQHKLFSAAVLYRSGQPIWRHIGVVKMTMRDFSDDYLSAYLAKNWPAVSGAVGGYHLEGEGARFFSNIQGDYFSVLGLPLIELLSYLTQAGEIDG